MVHHIILWNLRAETAEQKRADALGIKGRLEGLSGVIDGLLHIRVIVDPLATGNAEVMLDSGFADRAALAFYQDHPAHLAAASFVRSVTQNRMCFDFEATP